MRRSKSDPARYARGYKKISQRRMTGPGNVDNFDDAGDEAMSSPAAEEKEMERLRQIMRTSRAHLDRAAAVRNGTSGSLEDDNNDEDGDDGGTSKKKKRKRSKKNNDDGDVGDADAGCFYFQRTTQCVPDVPPAAQDMAQDCRVQARQGTCERDSAHQCALEMPAASFGYKILIHPSI